MNKPSRQVGCAVAGLLVLALIAVAGIWWFFRPFSGAGGPPESAVQVFLLSPSSGDEVAAGDIVPVYIQASAPAGIAETELFVDGQSLGPGNGPPESASWTWQAWPAGIHTFTAHATASDGEAGESQTVILNVMIASDTMQILPGPGDTLAELGGQYGVPQDEMARANPHADPSGPLPDGQPVEVPSGGGGPQPPAGGGAGGGTIPLSIVWELEITKPADKSYCYLSAGDGVWQKIPAPPFNFFESLHNLYTQLFDAIPQQPITLQAQCWGWVGGALEYLGDGQTTFDIQDARGQLAMNGQGFKFTGSPQLPGEVVLLDAPLPSPAPYGLREPIDANDCLAHGGSASVCGASMTAISEIVLEWEWQAGALFPNDPAANIDGFLLYEQNAFDSSWKYLKQVTPSVKATALPLSWGVNCYAVSSFRIDPQAGLIESERATYCRNQPPATQQVIEAPSAWITTGGEWIAVDCPLKPIFYSFGELPAVLVGRYTTDYADGCYREGSYTGGVKFPLNSLPMGAVLQRATLKFSSIFMQYGSGFTAGPSPETCTSQVGTANMDWTALDNGSHYSKKEISGFGFFSPFSSLAQWSTPILDVTPIVKNWLVDPGTNHGFILFPAEPPYPHGGDTGKCLSGEDNFQLVIDFFAP